MVSKKNKRKPIAVMVPNVVKNNKTKKPKAKKNKKKAALPTPIIDTPLINTTDKLDALVGPQEGVAIDASEKIVKDEIEISTENSLVKRKDHKANIQKVNKKKILFFYYCKKNVYLLFIQIF